MTQREDALLRVSMSVANGSFMLGTVTSTIVAFVATNRGDSLVDLWCQCFAESQISKHHELLPLNRIVLELVVFKNNVNCVFDYN